MPRVIAGRLRSRTFAAPAGSATRPTTDRVREALFSILGDVSELRVLDLYAGSGGLGIEALSRGAAHATFVEARRPALATLQKNLRDLELIAQAEVLPLRVERAAGALRERGPFDLVFADPPWADLPQAAVQVFALLEAGVLDAGARVVFEHPARSELPVKNKATWTELDRRTWGDTQVSMYSLQNA